MENFACFFVHCHQNVPFFCRLRFSSHKSMKRKKFWSLFWTPLTLLQLIQASEHQNEIKTTFQETSDNVNCCHKIGNYPPFAPFYCIKASRELLLQAFYLWMSVFPTKIAWAPLCSFEKWQQFLVGTRFLISQAPCLCLLGIH